MPERLSDLVRQRLSRRDLLASAAAFGAASLLGCARRAPPPPAADPPPLGFAGVPRGLDGEMHVAPGYEARVLLRHGDPLFPGVPAMGPAGPIAADQERQFGDFNDFIAFFPLPRAADGLERGLLCVNHELCHAPMLWAEGYDLSGPEGAARAAADQRAHGMSIVEIARDAGGWRVALDGQHNRRVTAVTPCELAGPAAGHPRMRTSADPAGTRVFGTMHNCSGGVTPWRTVLTGEENVRYSFRVPDGDGPERESHRRMDMDGEPVLEWHRFERRFDAEAEPNEPNRFGWIVEIDPFDPQSAPRKRTALGRFAHEGAEVVLNGDGRVVVYMGDDGRDQRLYRYVSRGAYDPAGPDPGRLLDEGTLSVARFDADGLTWLPIDAAEGPLAEAFAGQADALIDARRAAELLGGTPMDRPERLAVSPLTGRVYAMITGSSRRAQADAANPRAPNPAGHVLELIPPGGDHAADRFGWDVLLLAGDPGDPASGARYGLGEGADGWLACPDNCAFDPRGRLWIATDGAEQLGVSDGLYACATSGPERGLPRLFFRCPVGAEVTGPCFTPDGRTLFLSVQHPGADSERGQPSTRWPDHDPALPPRSAVVVITRADGGEIGG